MDARKEMTLFEKIQTKYNYSNLNVCGDLHRSKNPAVVFDDDSVDYIESWWKHGIHHRDDGPATICKNGELEYWLYGEKYSYIEWKFLTNPYMAKKDMVKLVMTYG